MDFLNWFTGNDHSYHPLLHCMDGDVVWAAFLVGVKIAVLVPYGIIAWIWYRNSKSAEGSNSSSALNHLMWIFIFCAICGYGLTILDLVWPAKRLAVIAHIPLVMFAWMFIFKTRYIKMWYSDLNRNASLRKRLQRSEWERKQLTTLVEDQEKSLKDSSRALRLISKTKKEISNGAHDDFI